MLSAPAKTSAAAARSAGQAGCSGRHAASRLPHRMPLRRDLAVLCSAGQPQPGHDTRRSAQVKLLGLGAAAAAALMGQQPARADDFVETPSGLRYLDIKVGSGRSPEPGDTCVVHWAGYTKGYQAKRIDNTSLRDEPYEFVLGAHQAIPAFEEAVAGMQAGGVRRVEVPGSAPGLGYPRDRSERFVDKELFKYRYGPQPVDLGGQRALDFVLDNGTLQDFNRTLLFDIKLLSVRPRRA